MNYVYDFSNGHVNPYNFVRLGNGVSRTSPPRGDNTGVIRCRLRTATPLAVPDSASVRNVMTDDGRPEHRKVDFFKVGGKCVIPGSEIRGVIRSVYETLSDSCLSVNNNNILTARSSDVRNPGILRWETGDGKWHLYKACAKTIENEDDISDYMNDPNYLIRKWYNIKDKKSILTRFNYICKDGKKIEEKIVSDDTVNDYNEVCNIYLEHAADDSKEDEENSTFNELKKCIEKPRKDGRGYPVYYKKSGTAIYLSSAQISRSVFRKRVDDLLGSYRHCSDRNNVCEACSLFGMIEQDDIGREKENRRKNAIASRVRFADAAAVNAVKCRPATLRELSSPKLSSVEFYSHFGSRSMEKLWTYDDNGLLLNGRKYYFHHSGEYGTAEKTKRNITAELADKNSVFEFDVYFDRLTDRELERLVWTLALGENDENGRQMHKLGHGKPLGLGSVKITVTSVIKRFFDRKSMRYYEMSEDVGKYFLKVPFDESAG